VLCESPGDALKGPGASEALTGAHAGTGQAGVRPTDAKEAPAGQHMAPERTSRQPADDDEEAPRRM